MCGHLRWREHPGHHEVRAHERRTEGQDGQRLGQHHTVLAIPSREEHAQRTGEGKQGQGTENSSHCHGPQAMRKRVAQCGPVPVLGGPGHPVEQHRGQGQGNNRVRQQVQLAGNFEDRVPGQRFRGGIAGLFQPEPFRTRYGGNSHDVEEGELPDGGRRQRPDAQPRSLAQSHAAPAKARPQAQPEPEHRDQQDSGLGHDAHGGKTRHQEGIEGRPVLDGVRIRCVCAQDGDKHAETGDSHDVVQDRRPHRGSERSVGVEYLGEQGIQAVEEDLRQAPERKGHGQSLLLRRIALRCQFDDPGGQQCDEEREGDQHQDGQRQESADVVRSPVRTLAGLDDLRYQDGVEDAACHQQEDQVWQVVRVDEGVVDRRAEAQGGRQHPGLPKSQKTRDERPGSHDGAGTGFSRLDGVGIGGAGGRGCGFG